MSLVPAMAAAAATGRRVVPIRDPICRRIGCVYSRQAFGPPAQRALAGWLTQGARSSVAAER